ncbi:MAG: glycine cleavage system protein GcvH [Thermoplasmata archaeon]|nr:glycine cleavage system protein GcvH [Thermoplasmata archaeon]
MSKIDESCKYTETDEWVNVTGNKARIGITDYAQHKLNDLTYVDLPEIGMKVSKGEPLLVVESVKSAADINAPISGTVIEVNEELEDNAETINKDPYAKGWIVVMELEAPDELDSLLDASAYAKKIGE